MVRIRLLDGNGIALAYICKDNRAFCKYICPMNVEVPNNSRKRKNATECILCMKCVEECPKKALKL